MTPLCTAASMWSSLRTVVVLSTVLIARLVSSRPLLFLFFAGPSVTVRENPTFSSVRDQLSNPSYEKSHSQAFGWSAGTPLLLPSCREMLPLVPFVHEESHLGPSFSPNPDSPALPSRRCPLAPCLGSTHLTGFEGSLQPDVNVFYTQLWSASRDWATLN